MAKNNKKEVELVIGLPDPTATLEEKKSDDYGIQWAKYIENKWFGSSSQYFRARHDKISINRAYANAQQSTDKYKQLVNDTGDQSFMSMDYEILSVVPKYVKLITDYIMGIAEKAKARGVDPLSATEREEYKNELVFRKDNKELLEEAKEAFGQQFTEDDFIPNTMDEIKVYMATKYKQSVEIAMNQAIELVLQLNDWPDEKKRQVIEDIIIDGYAGVKIWTDAQHGIRMRRIDPLYGVFPTTKSRDLHEAEYGGEIYQMSIYELKRIMSGNNYTDEEWKKIAKAYSGKKTDYNGINSTSNYSAYTGERIMEWESVMVDVMDFAFKTPCKRRFEEKSSKYGNKGFYPKKKEDYTPPENSETERSVHDYDYETVFSGMYVIRSSEALDGRGVILDYKQQENTTHSSKDIQKAELPFKFFMPNQYKMNARSYVDMMRTPEDQMQLAHLKLQQMVAQAKPTGYSVNLSGLEPIKIGKGGEALTPIQITQVYDQTGTYYHRTINPETGEWIGDSPIKPLPNAIQNIPELVSTYNFYLDQIRNITGITPEMEGIIGNRQAYKTVESSKQSSGGAISDVAHAYKRLLQRSCEHIAGAFQDVVEYGKGSNVYKSYKEAIGAGDIAVIDSLDDISLRTFGITIELDIDMIEAMELQRNIDTALAAREITPQDAFAVRAHAKVDTLLASELLDIRMEDKRKRDMEEKQMLITIEQEKVAESAERASAARMQEMKLEAQLYQQKKAIDLQYEQQLKQIDAGIDSQLSTQEFYHNLQLKSVEISADNMKSQMNNG